MIIESFRNRLNVLKSNSCHIQYVLDIGAYRGDFTDTINSVWPSVIVRQIEADERQLPYLKDSAIIALLGNSNSEVDFYTLAEEKITTGSSIFKELTPHYNSESTIILKKRMTTLDILDSQYNFFGDWKNLGLVKIDTQGSEILILEGATNFLEVKQPKYILLECSIVEYNAAAPRIADTIAKMHKFKYAVKDVFDLSYDKFGNLIQTDILFERNKQ